jgi:hypothetical protein
MLTDKRMVEIKVISAVNMEDAEMLVTGPSASVFSCMTLILLIIMS